LTISDINPIFTAVKKIAVIDCGTNTFNLLIAEVTREGWTVLFHNKIAVKLGEGGFDDGLIQPHRFARGLDALLVHKAAIDNYECEHTLAFATSALRETSNGKAFIQRAKALFGIEIELISGDREAELIWEGVRKSMNLGEDPVCIMDIGGGSTEFVIANAHTIFWKKSYLLGVSRITETIQPSDKIETSQLRRLEEILHSELTELRTELAAHRVEQLVGSSGSFDTLRAMHYRDAIGETLTSLHADIPLDAFQSMHQWLLRSTLADRLKHPAIPGIRAQYMPLAAHLVYFVLGIHPFKRLTHSAYSLKEGAIDSMIKGIDWPEITEA
jgi:exopolyphosphatase / guanosine-5'-triphosphate,3'-diphosphate pyrophosphatase